VTNFVFIITDQQRADHLGCYGNTIVRTPNIDALARKGFRAEKFYVANPVCMPNRASLMTGRMPSLHGVRHNGVDLRLSETTFVELLLEAGYHTMLVGKAHLQCIHDGPAFYPKPEERLAHEARHPDHGRYDQEFEKNWESNPEHDLTYPYYGFAKAALTIMHGDGQYGHWRRWLRSQDKDADRLIGPENAIPTPGFELRDARQAWRTRVPEELYPNAWITERTLDAIRESARSGKAFFVQCSYPDPHHPFTPPGRYWSMYSPDDVPLPPSYSAGHHDVPHSVQWLRDMRDAGKAFKTSQAPFACTQREAREAIALNYGTISQIDDGVGRIVAELERLGIAQDTVVVFTSDHGDFMGDHQVLLKGPMHYQGIVSVPFIWADPAAKAGVTSDALLQSIDFAPSVLERAGVAPFNGIQGSSMLPIIAGQTAATRDALVIEDDRQRPYPGFEKRGRTRSLVTRTHRISIHDGGHWGELFDLADDPNELVNLWNDKGARNLKSEMLERLARAMMTAGEYTSPYPRHIA
jgi:arylsulfatase A-like enzyme